MGAWSLGELYEPETVWLAMFMKLQCFSVCWHRKGFNYLNTIEQWNARHFSECPHVTCFASSQFLIVAW